MEVLGQTANYFNNTAYALTGLFLILGIILIFTHMKKERSKYLEFAAIVLISVVIILRIIAGIMTLIVYLKTQ